MSPQLPPLVYPWAAQSESRRARLSTIVYRLLCLYGSEGGLYDAVLSSMSTTGTKAAPGRISHATGIVRGGYGHSLTPIDDTTVEPLQ